MGMTESGKTTFAKRLCPRYREHGIRVIVLDPLCDPGWMCDYQTTDPEEFLRVFWSSRRCVAIIDEAGDTVGRYDDVMQRTATRGRHWGHSCHYITQRGVQIASTVRHQCSRLYLFTSARSDGKIHADEWNAPVLANCHTLKQGEYYACTRFGEVSKHSLFGVTHDDFGHSGDGRRDIQRESRPAQEEQVNGRTGGNPADDGDGPAPAPSGGETPGGGRPTSGQTSGKTGRSPAK